MSVEIIAFVASAQHLAATLPKGITLSSKVVVSPRPLAQVVGTPILKAEVVTNGDT